LRNGKGLDHVLAHLLERPGLDLMHALARDAELVHEFVDGDRLVRQPARLENAPLARIERVEQVFGHPLARYGVTQGLYCSRRCRDDSATTQPMSRADVGLFTWLLASASADARPRLVPATVRVRAR
jgi:hypothetical protein